MRRKSGDREHPSQGDSQYDPSRVYRILLTTPHGTYFPPIPYPFNHTSRYLLSYPYQPSPRRLLPCSNSHIMSTALSPPAQSQESPSYYTPLIPPHVTYHSIHTSPLFGAYYLIPIFPPPPSIPLLTL